MEIDSDRDPRTVRTHSSIWRTLRFRLAAWNAVVVLLTALVTLFGLRHGVQWALLHEMDQILTEDAREISLMLGERPVLNIESLQQELDRKARGHQQHGWFVELLDSQNRRIWGTVDSPGEQLTDDEPVHESPVSIDDYRIIEMPVTGAPNGISTIGIGAKLDLLRRDTQQIDRLVIITVAITAVFAPLCGYWLAGRATRTLGAILKTAVRLRPTHMNERLPVFGTGDELDTLAKTVNRLLDRIATYLDEKRAFLANAAHELRTPLAAIRSSVEVALNSDRSREEYEELLEDIIEQVLSLETLVNQLLLLSESDAEQMAVQGGPVALEAVVAKSIEMFRGVAESRNVELAVGRLSPAKVSGNRQHLRQVANNLIDNAIKYTPPGGRIEVNLFCNGDEHAQFVVRDTGIGISADDLPHIFERFFRADRSRSRMKDALGTGLGLSICHAVVVAHHGRITCESEVGRGTVMTVVIPLITAAPQPAIEVDESIEEISSASSI